MRRPVFRRVYSTYVVLTAAIFMVATSASAQLDRDPSLTVTLNQDTFFGFNPAFNGLIPINEDVDFSLYGIFWTSPSFSSGALFGDSNGFDLWTEFGGGVNFHFLDGRLQVQPQLGILSGVLLSGGEC